MWWYDTFIVFCQGQIISNFRSTIAFLVKPTTTSCYITRILPGLSFSMIYGSVLTKTNRIARILARGKKKIITKKPRCMTTASLVVVTVMLIGVELGIIVAILLWQRPATEVCDGDAHRFCWLWAWRIFWIVTASKCWNRWYGKWQNWNLLYVENINQWTMILALGTCCKAHARWMRVSWCHSKSWIKMYILQQILYSDGVVTSVFKAMNP